MSKEAKDILGFGVGFLMILTGIVVSGWIVIQVCSGVGNWWGQLTKVTPEQQARIDKSEKEWDTNPLNPKVAGQKCLDLGGVPDYSAWDGDVKACNKPGDNGKNVKIEVNQ